MQPTWFRYVEGMLGEIQGRVLATAEHLIVGEHNRRQDHQYWEGYATLTEA